MGVEHICCYISVAFCYYLLIFFIIFYFHFSFLIIIYFLCIFMYLCYKFLWFIFNFIFLYGILLSKYNSYSIHHRNIQSLATKLYKVQNQWPVQIMYNIFGIQILFITSEHNAIFPLHELNQFPLVSIQFSILQQKSGILFTRKLRNVKA